MINFSKKNSLVTSEIDRVPMISTLKFNSQRRVAWNP